MAHLGNRIVVLIDMDCFYCQVETRLQPQFAGKPLAVVQYNQWRSGGIIAVNYEARDFGVTRHMRGDEAKEKCPDIILARVPCVRGKADTSKYRSAGREVIAVLQKHCPIVERASVDEAYLDITQIVDDKLTKQEFDMDIKEKLKATFVVGHSECGNNDEDQRRKGLDHWLSESEEDLQIQRLAIAGEFIENLRKEVLETTTFKCSAGISFNKILAKLACGIHKPNRQTILPASSVAELFSTLPVKKVRNLGGKLGNIVIDSLECNVMSDLLPYSLQQLQTRFDDKTGLWLYNIARGIDSEPVTPRLVSKSIGACKRFPGKTAIVDSETLKHWISELVDEMCERLEQDLEENERKASLLTVSFQFLQDKKTISQSRSYTLSSYKPEKMIEQCLNMVTKATQQLPILFLGLSAGKFIQAKGSENFKKFFKTVPNVEDATSLTIVQQHTDFMENESLENNIEISSIVDNSTESPYFAENSYENSSIDTIDETPKSNLMDNSSKSKSPFAQVKSNNRKSSPCSKLKKTLQTDNFKKSFFMSILKDKKCDTDKIESCSGTDQVSIRCSDRDDLIKENDVESGVSDIEDDISDNIAENGLKDPTEESEKIKSKSPKSIHSPQNSIKLNQYSVGLQEIFPDLNDIDPEVVKMLPLHLREEAKKLITLVEKSKQEIETNKQKNKTDIKSNRGRPRKSKCASTVTARLNIQNFFIKANENDDLQNLKTCSQCGQSILLTKFEEHIDYHVAQNLQKEFNRPPAIDDSRKRKSVDEESDQLKKRANDEISLTNN